MRFVFSIGLGGILATPAFALDIEPTVATFYFSSSSAKVLRAETESAEDGLKFRAARDPRTVARDLASEELQHGNVCLNQAQRDLREALKKNQVLNLCKKIYRSDLDAAVKKASSQKLRPDYFRCAANMEAHEVGGSITMVLSFRGQLVMHDNVPVKLHKAGIGVEPRTWTLPTHESPIGEAGVDWKEVLKKGSCTVDEDVLNAFLERLLDQAKDAKALARCRTYQLNEVERVAHLQRQFKEYVPEDWLKDAAGKESAALLEPAFAAESYGGLKECKSSRKHTSEQLSKLMKAAKRIADKHDLPALDPEKQAGARAPASVEGEDF